MMKESYGFKAPLLNAGAGNPVEQRYYLPAYQEIEHATLDNQPLEGIDIVEDICDMPNIPSCSYGTIISLDTFEHVAYPFKAIKELARVLKPNGLLILTTHQNYAIHRWSKLKDDVGFGTSNFNDYWRFCPDGLKLLFKDANLKLLDIRLHGGRLGENMADLPIGKGADEQSAVYIYATGKKTS